MDPSLDPETLRPMEARSAEALPTGPGWQYEPKWDGFRCLAFRSAGTVELRSKSGQPLGRYFPDIVAAVEALPQGDFVLDGELVIRIDGALSFDALQLRLHPAASRVRKLVAEHPATFILFDLLAAPPDGRSLLGEPLRERRAALQRAFHANSRGESIELTPIFDDIHATEDLKRRLGGSVDGIVAKRLEEPYQPGERSMIKVKSVRTADCVVGGFRYGQKTQVVGSLLLGLYDDAGLLNHVGFTSSIPAAERPALTKKLQSLIEPPGFTGNAPGGPSRWSNGRSADWKPLKPELVVEVSYDHVSSGRFRHGTRLVRWRPDKAPSQCTYDQIARPLPAGALQ